MGVESKRENSKEEKILPWIVRLFVSVVPHCTCFCCQTLSHQTYMGEVQIPCDSSVLFGKKKEKPRNTRFPPGCHRRNMGLTNPVPDVPVASS